MNVPERYVEEVRDVPPVHLAAELVFPLVPTQPVGEVVIGKEAVDRPYTCVPRRQGTGPDVPPQTRYGVRDFDGTALRKDALVRLVVIILDDAVAVTREGSSGARLAVSVVSVGGVEVLR